MSRRFDAVMDALEAGVVIHASDTTIVEANERARALLGIRDLKGRLATDPAWVFLEADGSPMPLERFPVMQVLASGRSLRDLLMIVRPPDADDVWATVSATPVLDEAGDLREVAVTFLDVTERSRYESELAAAARQLSETERIGHVGHWHLDLATDRVTWSPALYAMFGMDPSDGPPDYSQQARIFTPSSWARLQAAVARARERGEPYQLDLEIVRKDGSTGWVDARAEAVRDASGAIVQLRGISLDVTDRVDASRRLSTLATRDALTGLANRATLIDDLSRQLLRSRREGTSTAALLIDLDHFKDINDTFGHGSGDELLVAAGDRLRDTVREGDLVARLGGDEFVVLMPRLNDPLEPEQVANRIVSAFRAPFLTSSGEFFSTASVGVAISSDAATAGDLLRDADTALYAAKDAGRNRVASFDERLRAAVSTRLRLETDLRLAVESGQLQLWYQPEVDLATGAVVGLEALLRWPRPDGEVWSADRFVEVLEESGLILDVGPWALAEACGQAAAWSTDARPTIVRVNVSAVQLAEASLLDDVDGALAGSGLDPRLLCIELTETALLHHSRMVATNLAEISARGVSIAVDDFGTGYASLTNLSLYPVDLIKIDRTFVTDPAGLGHDYRVVAAVVGLAGTLGMQVTAEGVELPAHVEHLLALGCRSGQGYLFSPAVPPEDVPALLRQGFGVPDGGIPR